MPPHSALWALYERLAMVLGLGALALICLTWLPFAQLLHLLLPARAGRRVGRWMIAFGFRLYLGFLQLCCGCRFDLRALDALRQQGPVILAANHPSLLDAVLILSRLPNAVCVMKASLMDSLLFGAAARLARYVRNDGAHRLIRLSRDELALDSQLLLFPEGTRTTLFPLNPLTPTLSAVARRSGAPVQTVLLEFSTPYLGKAWPLFRRPELPLVCRARLGQRFEPTDIHADFSAQLEAYFRQVLPAEHAA